MGIRLAVLEDAPALADIYRPYVEDTAISFELAAPSETMMRERMSRVMGKLPWLVCEEDGALAGYAYASPHHDRAAYQWSVDTSVYLRRGLQRRGLGRALYSELFTLLVQQGYYTAFAGISLPNAASVGLHESFGFRAGGRVSQGRIQIRRLARCGLVAEAAEELRGAYSEAFESYLARMKNRRAFARRSE